MFILVGCADYQAPLDNAHHQTRFSYMVVKSTNAFGPVQGGFHRGGILKELVLVQNEFGGGFSID